MTICKPRRLICFKIDVFNGLSRAIKDNISLVRTGVEEINASVSQLQTSQRSKREPKL